MTHFNKGPAYGLSAEVRSKVSVCSFVYMRKKNIPQIQSKLAEIQLTRNGWKFGTNSPFAHWLKKQHRSECGAVHITGSFRSSSFTVKAVQTSRIFPFFSASFQFEVILSYDEGALFFVFVCLGFLESNKPLKFL